MRGLAIPIPQAALGWTLPAFVLPRAVPTGVRVEEVSGFRSGDGAGPVAQCWADGCTGRAHP